MQALAALPMPKATVFGHVKWGHESPSLGGRVGRRAAAGTRGRPTLSATHQQGGSHTTAAFRGALSPAGLPFLFGQEELLLPPGKDGRRSVPSRKPHRASEKLLTGEHRRGDSSDRELEAGGPGGRLGTPERAYAQAGAGTPSTRPAETWGTTRRSQAQIPSVFSLWRWQLLPPHPSRGLRASPASRVLAWGTSGPRKMQVSPRKRDTWDPCSSVPAQETGSRTLSFQAGIWETTQRKNTEIIIDAEVREYDIYSSRTGC